MTEDQEKLALEILGKSLDITVATIRPDGWPQATTVSFVSDGLDIYFGTDANSQKSANIARDSRVSVTANAPYRTWDQIRSLSLAGEAAFVTEPAEMTRVGELMLKRFGDEIAKQTSIDMSQTRIVHIRPKVLSILDYSKGFGHKSDLVLALPV
ncbi:MAG: pyridoxamine 5'-phosphate oxidase family protein [Hyphomonadaceae bacterium]|nr:pyridoxamine 5'-phosphate oxidase family protein [Hyphomonadaceae bacterium]